MVDLWYLRSLVQSTSEHATLKKEVDENKRLWNIMSWRYYKTQRQQHNEL